MRRACWGPGPAAARQQRLTDMAKQQSDADEKTLAAQATEADHAKDGTAAEKLGEAYVGYGRYDAAIAALQKGIVKGGLKAPDDAKLSLGIAYLRGGQKAKAKEVLQSLTGPDGVRDLAGSGSSREGRDEGERPGLPVETIRRER